MRVSWDRCYRRNLGKLAFLFLLLLHCPLCWPQAVSPKPSNAEATSEPPKDTLGRGTPRGAVVGFLNAFHKNNIEIAVLYLNTPLRGADATALAHELGAVLNRYLPPRLTEISDKPEGSLRDPLKPDEDVIGTIQIPTGDFDIVVERVDRGKAGKVWLFSRQTLTSMPKVTRESNIYTVEKHLPEFLVNTRLLNVPLFQWIAVFGGIPLVYFITGLLNRLLSWIVGDLRPRILRSVHLRNPSILLPPIRVLLVVLFIRWVLSKVELPFFARQGWFTLSLMMTITACVWLLLLVNGWIEHYLVGLRRGMSGSAAVLRLFRRLADGLVLFAGLLFVLYYLGVNVTAALAGLGVGGIAVALAAQKTLENLIAGISLIVDQVIRVGDFLNVGDVQGTVVEIGLRSTRIRTLDRTLVSLPNGQIATMTLETVSARDKYLFHPVIGLRCETTPVQLRSVIAGVHDLLSKHGKVDLGSIRVRFIRLGTSSRDVDIFVYVFATGWDEFLEIQEELLFGIMDIIARVGIEMALPSQTLYLETDKIVRHRTDLGDTVKLAPVH